LLSAAAEATRRRRRLPPSPPVRAPRLSTPCSTGIDYPGGRLVVSFEKSAADAEAYASIAKTNGETAVVKGTVAITVPADPHAEADQPAVEECVTGG
jgi:hypothetical protein